MAILRMDKKCINNGPRTLKSKSYEKKKVMKTFYEVRMAAHEGYGLFRPAVNIVV